MNKSNDTATTNTEAPGRQVRSRIGQHSEQLTPCTGQTRSDEYLNSLKSQMPQMQRLFELLDAGGGFNFLDVMSALGEMSLFITDSDQNDEVLELLELKMSGKKCRVCS